MSSIRKSRKSFASETLEKISNRLNYYKRMLKNKTPEDIEASPRLKRIQNKHNHELKVRFLCHRYEYVTRKVPIDSPFKNLIIFM